MDGVDQVSGTHLYSRQCPECGVLHHADGSVTTVEDRGTQVHDRDGNAYARVRSLRLLDSIDTQLVRSADGTSHAVLEPRSGRVLAAGDTPEQASETAGRVARYLGRRRLRAALDLDTPIPERAADVEPAPSAPTAQALSGQAVSNPPWQELYDRAVRQAAAWEVLHHNGGAPDKEPASMQYLQLQDQLRRAITSPNTPDEARLPLATAGYQLYVGGNAVGLVDAEHIPYAALEAAIGSMAFSGGASVEPRVRSGPPEVGLLPPKFRSSQGLSKLEPDRLLDEPSDWLQRAKKKMGGRGLRKVR